MPPRTSPLHRRSGRGLLLAGLLAVALALVAGACGSEPELVLDAQGARGRTLARDRGCTSCHTPDGRRSEGPSWKGVYGSTVQLADGTRVVADDAYIARAIKEPKAQVVQGYPPAMPAVTGLTDADIAALTAYLKALR
jgi:cytochrome c oxidase subunit 2